MGIITDLNNKERVNTMEEYVEAFKTLLKALKTDENRYKVLLIALDDIGSNIYVDKGEEL